MEFLLFLIVMTKVMTMTPLTKIYAVLLMLLVTTMTVNTAATTMLLAVGQKLQLRPNATVPPSHPLRNSRT